MFIVWKQRIYLHSSGNKNLVQLKCIRPQVFLSKFGSSRTFLVVKLTKKTAKVTWPEIGKFDSKISETVQMNLKWLPDLTYLTKIFLQKNDGLLLHSFDRKHIPVLQVWYFLCYRPLEKCPGLSLWENNRVAFYVLNKLDW